MRFTTDGGKRYDTAKMQTLWAGPRDVGTGITLEGVYMTPKSKRVFVETYSIWEDRHTHGHIGRKVHEADQAEIAQLAQMLDLDDLYELLPEGD